VVFDDTVYFLPCHSEGEAAFLSDLLNSAAARDFYGSMVFWADKRPITVDLLRRLSLAKLAAEMGRGAEYEQYAPVAPTRFTRSQTTREPKAKDRKADKNPALLI